jgi:hypothetical protein
MSNIDTLKIINLIALIIMCVITCASFKEVWHDKKSWLFGLIEVEAGFAPTKWWFISLFITVFLFVFGVGLGGNLE